MGNLFKKTSNLTGKTKTTLAGLLLESLECDPDPEVEKAWQEEINRRFHQLDDGEVEPMLWEVVRHSVEKCSSHYQNLSSRKTK